MTHMELTFKKHGLISNSLEFSQKAYIIAYENAENETADNVEKLYIEMRDAFSPFTITM